MATSELFAGVATSVNAEPGAGSDLRALQIGAVRGSNHHAINGAKNQLPQRQPDGRRLQDRSGARRQGRLVDRGRDRRTAGFRIGRILEKIGNHALDTCELLFDDVHVPVANLIGGVEDQSFA